MAEDKLEVFTPASLKASTVPKKEETAKGGELLGFLKEANALVSGISNLVKTGQALANMNKPRDEKVSHESAKYEKGLEAGIKQANAGNTTPRGAPQPTVEKKIIVDAPKVRELLKAKIEMISDEMTGKEAKDLIKPLLEAETFDAQIIKEINNVVRLE